ncbi:DUF1674 domain-containing protein [Pelagibius sp. Alg239-R121]|uniref:DUF1674 domain-containing protein n=1 Tax=Pelagibius sp. Alg239-R121 TaxID=2993448 RepID=UPI0024A74211|nr:DUF1674 domain-containing protein [Pelagibius sp. Alg239-R121]
MTKLFTSHKPAPAKTASAAAPTSTPKPQGQKVTPEKMEKAAAMRARSGQLNLPKEIGGPEGPEPTRYGDWERNGICSDF